MIDKKNERKLRYLLAIERGYVYCKKTGIVTTPHGNVVKRKTNGYLFFNIRIGDKRPCINVHQFAWFFVHSKIVDYIDHKNCIRDDNRIKNLRSVTSQENHFNNSVAKGYCLDKSRNKWLATIKLNGKQKNLGRFNSETEAKKVYLDAKKIYHKISSK
jgi:hypothetical protein